MRRSLRCVAVAFFFVSSEAEGGCFDGLWRKMYSQSVKVAPKLMSKRWGRRRLSSIQSPKRKRHRPTGIRSEEVRMSGVWGGSYDRTRAPADERG